MSLLIKNALYVVTMDDENSVLKNSDIYIEDGFIKEIGKDLDISKLEVKDTIDATNKIVYPGLINTHHHFYQTMTRNYPNVQNMELFDWLKALYQLWRGIDSEMIYNSSLVAMGELVKYGCTTVQDHHYVFPNGKDDFIDMQIKAAKDLGVRIHASRGSMSLGESDGGLPPDSLVQTSEEILKDSERLIKKYHDSSKGSFHQIVLAPCSPFSVTTDLLKDSAELARRYGVRLHTHLAETIDEENYTLDKFNMRPLEYMDSVNWLGEDVWFAHGIHFNDEEMDVLEKTKTGIAHCPVSNMKLSSGIARISEMIDRNMRVSLAVDGSASNDCSNMLAEIRTAYLLQRLSKSRKAPTGDKFLRLATRGGADILGRDDIGSLEIGKAADCFMIDATKLEYSGTLDSPDSIPAVCGINSQVDKTIIGGKVVFDGQLKSVDEEKIVARANEFSDKLRQYR